MKISSIFDRVNDQLSNAGYVTWTEPVMRQFYEEAVTVLLTALPVGHVETLDLALAAGTHQVLPASVRSLLTFVENRTAAGVAQTPVAEPGDMGLFRDEQAALSANDYSTYDYQVFRVYLEPLDPSAFYVLPPVPAGYTGKLRSRAATQPTVTNWAAVGGPDFPLRDGFDVAVVEHMLYRTFGRADETSPDYNRALSHQQLRDAEIQRLASLLGVPVTALQMAEVARQ